VPTLSNFNDLVGGAITPKLHGRLLNAEPSMAQKILISWATINACNAGFMLYAVEI
jgi:hypothetical protein